MSDPANGTPTVVRTSRGLSIAGTRITLYAILDYVHADWPPHLIADWFHLTSQQMVDVMAYIHDHHDEVEREYQEVIRQAEENRRYWEERNQERFARIATTPPPPEQAALREKLQEWKKRLEKS
jgi:uncharacterized protein (DUF433 family)